jgi:hypothetical protein
MKKLLRFADVIALLCGILGMALQFWILISGTDEKGLFPAFHPGWVLSWVLAIAVMVFLFLLTRQVGNHRGYKTNFPASVVGAVGCVVAALAVAFTGISHLRTGTMWLDSLSGILGIAGGLGLLVAAYCRFRGKKPPFVCYMLPCIFFALHVFYLGRELGGEPEAVRYLFRFLATLSLIPACYQLWGFCVGAGERKDSLFWSLFSGFLCILSAPIGGNALLYLALGYWLLSNTCLLKYLPRQNKVAPPAAPEAEEEECMAQEEPAAPEIPCTMEEALLPTEEPATEAPATEPEPQPEPDLELDVDAIIAEILREIDSNVE